MECASNASRIKDFLNEGTWAVVGASMNQDKFGYKVYKSLVSNWNVYPINPKLNEIDGVRCYPSLADLPEKPGVVNIITPPAVTLDIVKECARLGIPKIWMQPGAESVEAIAFCEAHQIAVIYGSCAMVEARHFKD